jgi:hypothetical protein
MPGAESPDIQTLRGTQFQMDPSIPYRAAAAKRNLYNTYQNPTGGYTTPAMQDMALRAGNRQIDEQAAQQARVGQYDVNQQNFQKNAYLASLTAPPLVQTGGTYNQNQVQKTPFSAKIMPAMQQGAMGAMMAAAGA